MAPVAVEVSPIEALERRLEDLLVKYERSRQENMGLRQEGGQLKEEIVRLNGETRDYRQEIAELKSTVGEQKSEIAALRAEGGQLKSERDLVKERINKLIGQVDEHLGTLV